MLVTRFLFGAGEAGCFPNLTKAFTAWLPREERVARMLPMVAHVREHDVHRWAHEFLEALSPDGPTAEHERALESVR